MKKKEKLRKRMVSLKKTMLALTQQSIEFMVITFWFQGIPWNHRKLYPASHISSQTPEITYNFGINWNQNPAPQVFLWNKSKFNKFLISGNFLKLYIKIDQIRLHPAIPLLSRTPPILFLAERNAICSLIIISEYISVKTPKF